MPGITAVPDVVDAPTIGSATAGVESATVTYTAAATGGAATSFTAISTPGSITGSSATSPITVSGLTGGTSYTFKVYGANSSGTWSVNQSSASNSVTPTVATAFQSIATTTVGAGGSSTISFTSIPSTYAHLQLRMFYKNTGSVFMTLNSTSSTKGHYLYTEGSTVASGVSATNFIANASSSQWGNGIVDILDYTNTNKLITVKNLAGYDGNGSGELSLNSEFYNLSSTAVNAITITPTSGTFAQYSSFALYGIKSA
jgi:hypothetical protein